MHNHLVRRRLLFALLLCSTAWATLAQIVPPSASATTSAAAANICSETEAEAPGGAGDSGSRWDAGYRSNASIPESLWKSSVVHADLAGAPSGEVLIERHPADRPDRPAGNRPAHLLHIPLLI